MIGLADVDEFSENFQGGEGGVVISNPKNYVADFSTSPKKGNIVFRKGGGGSKAVCSFSENSSKSTNPIIPNRLELFTSIFTTVDTATNIFAL